VRLPLQTGWYVNASGARVELVIDYWRARGVGEWWNAETPAGLLVETSLTGALMCEGCFGNEWDQFLDATSQTFTSAGIAILQIVASVAAFVPGIGTGVAFALTAAAALANGENISDAMVDATVAAIPGSLALQVAAESGKSLLRGENIGEAALAGARAVAVAEGGRFGGASFDVVIAISRGKTLQDAGFAGLKSYAAGNTIAERAEVYAEKIATAARTGQPLPAVLEGDLRADVGRVAAYGGAELVTAAAERLIKNPAILHAGSDTIALALGVAEPIARAAQVATQSGTIDRALIARLAPLPPGVEAADASTSEAAGFLSYMTQAQKAALDIYRASSATAVDPFSAVSMLKAERGAAPLVLDEPEPAELTQAAAVARTGTAGDLALGATVAAALVALVWWARAR
jgi:hypothetical protein